MSCKFLSLRFRNTFIPHRVLQHAIFRILVVGGLVALPFIGSLHVTSRALAERPPAASTDEDIPRKHIIHFTVSVPNDQGQVACAIFRKDGWLKRAVIPAFSRIRNGEATCTFENVPPGEYAISAFHDKNENNELETNFLGIPTEDWCTSRNAKGFFGPPSFDDAKFEYAGGPLRLRGSM